MEENHQILQENSTELKDMSFKTETFNKHPAQWVQINPPKGKTLKSEHWGERPSENRGGGEKNGSHRRPRNEEGFKLLTNNTRNHMIMEQCLQNHEKKIIWRKKHQDKLSLSVWVGEKHFHACEVSTCFIFYTPLLRKLMEGVLHQEEAES